MTDHGNISEDGVDASSYASHQTIGPPPRPNRFECQKDRIECLSV